MGDCMVCELHLKKTFFFFKTNDKKDKIQGSSDCGKWEEGTLRRKEHPGDFREWWCSVSLVG